MSVLFYKVINCFEIKKKSSLVFLFRLVLNQVYLFFFVIHTSLSTDQLNHVILLYSKPSSLLFYYSHKYDKNNYIYILKNVKVTGHNYEFTLKV